MYQVACSFKSKQATDQPYQFLQSYLRESDSDCSIFRLLLNNVWTIAIVGSMVTPAMQRAIDKLLPIKQRITLPQDALQSLLARREKRSDEATPVPGKPGYKLTEQHTPTRLALDGTPVPVTPEDLTRLMREEALQTTHEAVERTKAKEPTILHVPDAETAMKAFDAIIAPNSQDTPSPLPVGSRVKMQTIPFIKGYQALHQQATTQDVITRVNQEYGRVPDNATRAITIISEIENTVLKAATKYRFTPSALAMHHAVYQPGNTSWVDSGTHCWIELDQPISTPYGENIRAIYAYNAFPLAEINKVIPETKDKHLHDVVLKSFIPHRVHWSLDIITMRCNTLFDFTYDTLAKRWVYLGSHICPYKTCQYIQEANLIEAVCLPCETCKQAIAYWSSWLHTAMLMIQGFYATSPSPTDFQVEPLIYSQEETLTVGKGKNKRKIRQNVTKQIDYRVVKYDVSVATPKPEKPIEHTGEKRLNWLQLNDRSMIIWEKKKLPAYQRKYPTRKDGTRQAGTVQIKEPFYKYVPMLFREVKTIKKVTASKYESEANQV